MGNKNIFCIRIFLRKREKFVWYSYTEVRLKMRLSSAGQKSAAEQRCAKAIIPPFIVRVPQRERERERERSPSYLNTVTPPARAT
jgi:hypothetical protein